MPVVSGWEGSMAYSSFPLSCNDASESLASVRSRVRYGENSTVLRVCVTLCEQAV